jgi:excisionase family DNA binding protein
MTIVTIKDVSEMIKVKPSTLYSWVKAGSIPHYRLNGVIRFDKEEIESWVQASRGKGDIATIDFRKPATQNIDKIVKRAIDETTGKRYNAANGKPGRHQGLRKEA